MSEVTHLVIGRANTESSPDNDADDYLLCGADGDMLHGEREIKYVTCKRCIRANDAREKIRSMTTRAKKVVEDFFQ